MFRALLINILAGIIGGIVADKKGRNTILWFILCTLFPLLVFVVLILPPVAARGVTKKCPYCAEIIKEEATVCKHCNKELPVDLVQCPNCGSFVPDKDYCLECNRRLK